MLLCDRDDQVGENSQDTRGDRGQRFDKDEYRLDCTENKLRASESYSSVPCLFHVFDKALYERIYIHASREEVTWESK